MIFHPIKCYQNQDHINIDHVIEIITCTTSFDSLLFAIFILQIW